MQGAGGVGGLLAVNFRTTGTHFAAFDGNGNVAALVNAADGTVSANYDYDPFGQTIRLTGPVGKLNPIRFSTQFADDVTEKVKYLYRDYSPSTGRWPSRDPLGERGGKNLYRFIQNEPIGHTDKDGQVTAKPVGIPFEGDCGYFIKYWIFQLDHPATCHGYIVQKVTEQEKFAVCGTTPTTTDNTFWEAWPVAVGTRSLTTCLAVMSGSSPAFPTVSGQSLLSAMRAAR
jgi:RHS repeat-associated protein